MNLAEQLAKRLTLPLPGYSAMARFAPELSFGRHAGPAPGNARRASVIALLCHSESGWRLPLTLRPAHLPDHAGQVCFPGGGSVPGEDDRQTALRELEEELGVPSGQVRMLGQMTQIYVFATNFWVTPFVGVLDFLPNFKPCEHEVEEVIGLPLSVLLDDRHFGRHQIVRGGLAFNAPHLEFSGHRIWGATSMMLGELISLLREVAATGQR